MSVASKPLSRGGGEDFAHFHEKLVFSVVESTAETDWLLHFKSPLNFTIIRLPMGKSLPSGER